MIVVMLSLLLSLLKGGYHRFFFLSFPFRDFLGGSGCFMLLFMQICSRVVVWGPFFRASTMVM